MSFKVLDIACEIKHIAFCHSDMWLKNMSKILCETFTHVQVHKHAYVQCELNSMAEIN